MTLDKRQRILQAAWEVFAAKGYSAAKISDIAAAAGVGKGTVYLYFSSKEELYIALLRAGMEKIEQEVLHAVQRETEPLAKLRAFMAEHLKQVISHKAQAKVLLANLGSSKKLQFGLALRDLAQQYLGHLAEIIALGQAEGVFCSSLSPQYVARCIMGGLNFLTVSVLDNNKDQLPSKGDQGELLKTAYTIFCSGICTKEVKQL